jgi:hypothetical protein
VAGEPDLESVIAFERLPDGLKADDEPAEIVEAVRAAEALHSGGGHVLAVSGRRAAGYCPDCYAQGATAS